MMAVFHKLHFKLAVLKHSLLLKFIFTRNLFHLQKKITNMYNSFYVSIEPFLMYQQTYNLYSFIFKLK